VIFVATSREKYTLEEVFKKDSPVTQKVLRGYVERHNVILYKCDICGCDGNWQKGQISLELDHIDGNNTNNEIDNLHYLCPNCHALTETYRGKNKTKTSDNIVSDEDFILALKSTKNIRQALIKLGISPAGANYTRAKRLMEQYDII
jgi:predicted restriction endonuclease